jgi:hypothetical protein
LFTSQCGIMISSRDSIIPPYRNQRDHSMRRIIACAVLLAMGVAADRALAEMIVLRDGRVLVGTISAEEPQQVRFKTGGPAGAFEMTISRTEVQAIYRGLDESKQIEQSGDATQLSAWGEQYFQAGLESAAANCVNRAVMLSQPLGEAPRSTAGLADKAAERFASFWNRTVLRTNAAAIAKRDAAGHLRLAAWAREGGLKEDSLFHLRRAWSFRPELAEVHTLAEKWKVRLEGAFRIDLRPALDESLFSDAVQDESQMVDAGAGKQFLTIPIRYESAAGPCTLSKATFRGKDMRGFYGLRSLSRVAGSLRLKGLPEEAIYERMDISLIETRAISGRATLRLDLLARNTSPPRLRDAPKASIPRTRPKSETLPATTWVALVLEIPKDLDELSFDWSDGREEVIDLSFLRRAADLSNVQPPGAAASQPASEQKGGSSPELSIPIVDRALGQLRAGHGSTATLAVAGLMRVRDRLFAGVPAVEAGESLPAWCRGVDAVLLSAMAGADWRLRQAIWAYFMGWRDAAGLAEVPAADLEVLSTLPSAGQLAVVDLLACATSAGPCGPWWSRIDARLNTEADESARKVASTKSASRMLGAILRGNSREACSRALDTFLRLDPALANWDELVDASPEGQMEALIRVDALDDRTLARQILRKLIARLRPKAARRMAQQAQSLGVRLGIEDRGILEQWHSMETSAERVSLLTALSGFDLGDLVYSPELSDVVSDATSDGEEDSVREAGLQLLMRQAERECQRSVSCKNGECFPLLVSRTAHNAMLRGLRMAVGHASTSLGQDALKLMIRRGYSEEAIRVIGGTLSPSEALAVLEAFISSPELARSDSFIAIMGRMLTPGNKGHARRILDHLSTVASQTQPGRRWRLYAALKAGVDIVAMDELAAQLPAPTSDAALVWLHSICHMTAQDRQRLSTLSSPEERLERLTEINLRRGRLVDGEYAGLVVIETMRPRVERGVVPGSQEERVCWESPVLQTIVMPRLTLRAVDQVELMSAPQTSEPADELREDSYRVLWKDRPIGMGYIVASPQPIRKPDSYCPSLVSGGEKWYEAKDKIIDESMEAVGPLQLPSRRVAVEPASGTMTLDVSAWLRAGLADAKFASAKGIEQLVPNPLPITLRYGAFGSYYGTAVRRPTPEVRPPDALPHLCNIMVVLERVDLAPGEAAED